MIGVYLTLLIPCLVLLVVGIVHKCRDTWPVDVGAAKFTMWILAIFFWPLTLVLYLLFSVVFRFIMCYDSEQEEDYDNTTTSSPTSSDDGGFGNPHKCHIRKLLTSAEDRYDSLTTRIDNLKDAAPGLKLFTDRAYSRCAVCMENLSDTYGHVTAKVLTDVCRKVRDQDKNLPGDMMAYFVTSKSDIDTLFTDNGYFKNIIDVKVKESLIYTNLPSNSPDVFLDDDDIGLTPCGHSFHYKCITKSLRTTPKCPECHTDIALCQCFVIYGDNSQEHFPFQISQIVYYIRRLKNTCFTLDSVSLSTASDHYYMTPVELGILSSHISQRVQTDDDIVLYREDRITSSRSGSAHMAKDVINPGYLRNESGVARQLEYGPDSPSLVIWNSNINEDTFV